MWLKQIFVDQFADIRRDEWRQASLLSFFFFLVIATFWILKPLKRGVLINYFGDQPLHFFGLTFAGAESEQIAKILNLIVVGFMMIFFTWLVRRCPRHYVVLIFAILFSTAFVIYALVIDQPTDVIVWSFFVLGDMFNSVLVALFWAFTNDIVTPEQSKRIYGVVGLGGVLGGFIGATVVRTSVADIGRPPLLLFCTVPMVLITLVAFYVHRRRAREDGVSESKPAAKRTDRGLALEGARLVVQSRYLLAIVIIIGCYELASNIIEFQLASTVEQQIEESLQKDAFFGLIGQVIGIGSILVQLLATGFIMRRFGIRAALSVLPVAILITSTGFLFVPTLLFAGAMSASHNGLNYSIQQSAKEALYVPTSEEVTYKAKAFIDMFVQRFAKVVSVAVNLALVTVASVGVRWLSLLTLVILGLWAMQVQLAGREYREKTKPQPEPDSLGSTA